MIGVKSNLCVAKIKLSFFLCGCPDEANCENPISIRTSLNLHWALCSFDTIKILRLLKKLQHFKISELKIDISFYA